jgi:hypothetical protein
MQRAIVVGIAALAFAAGGSSAWAKTTARLVLNPRAGCEFPADGLTLIVRRETGKTVRRALCSTSGVASRVRVVSDALDQSWVLVEESRGHGSNPAHSRDLAIYLLGARLTERAHIPIAQDWGLHGGVWRYDYQVLRPAVGGLEVVLRLNVAGHGDPGALPPKGPKIVRVTAR